MRTQLPPEQEQVRRQLVDFSVTDKEISSFVYHCVKSNDEQRARDQVYLESLTSAADMILSGHSGIQKQHLKSLILELNEALNLDIGTERLDPLWLSSLRAIRALGSFGLFLFISYLVLGGVWSNESGLSEEFSRWVIYSALAFLILVLAILEGTQLSVTALKSKDIESVKGRFPKAYQLHKLFKTDAGTKKYLAGRQMMVILIVFCIAQLISFPEIKYWPLSNTPLPDFFYPWIHLVFFKLGVLGAIFVLWFGQLIPQFLATSNPLKFLNWPGMGLVLKAALWSESLGVTQPVDWITKSAALGDKIPPSNKEIYFETSQNFGYAVLSLTKKIIIKANKTIVSTDSCIQVSAPDHDLIIDDSITFIAQDLITDNDATVCTLVRNGKPLDSSLLGISLDDRLDAQTDVCTRAIEVRLRDGNFEPGDVLKIENTMRLKRCETADITIKSPTRYASFHVEIHDKPAEVRGPSMVHHKWDAIRNGFSESGEEQVELMVRKDKGVLLFERAILFPKQLSKHCYSWAFNYCSS